MTELSENAKKVAEARYFMEGENWEGCSRRIGEAISYNEIDNKWKDIFAEEIYNLNFIPGGRILRNAGKLKQSMLNCACVPVSDSIESIGEAIKNSLILWSYGAGIGTNFSSLRPLGAPLKSKGGKSSGVVSFLKAIDALANTIETGGQRRSGLLSLLSVNHPEINEFIDAKLIDKTLSYSNLSVGITNSFLKAVEDNEDWELKFAGQTYKTIKASDLWDKIINGMIKCGDPGLINMDNLKKNNSFYFQPIEATNLCSELPLPGLGTCCLGALVLTNFLSGKSTNWKKLKNSVQIAVRFLDDVLDVNHYPIKETEIITKDARRLGLGVLGLADYLIKKNVRYGSERSLLEIERLFKFIRDEAYMASIELAKEKGAFPKYSRSEYTSASFVKKLPSKIRLAIKESGIRNVCILSCQPTGTTSLIPEVSSGIEPVFSLAYERKDRVSNRIYVHPEYKSFLESGQKEKPEWLVDVSELTPEDHFDVQSVITKYMDNSISKTINCPSSTTAESLSKLLLENAYDCKGITIYVDGCKDGQPMTKLSDKEIKQYLKENKTSSNLTEEDVKCKSGACEI